MSLLGEKAAEVMKEVMDDYGIEPGELYKSIEKTLVVIDELAPVVKDMGDTAESIEQDVNRLEEEIQTFNNNSEELAEALRDNAETLQKFLEVVEDIENDDL